MKNCLFCKKKLIGRIDKKFCNNECRNEFNNERYRVKNSEVLRINKILKKNRDILMYLNPEGKRVVPRETLLHEGFDFKYFTNIYFTKDHRQYFYCYEQGYLIDAEKDAVLMVVMKERQ